MNIAGIKHDTDKPDYSLLPPHALHDVVRVLSMGAKKYSADNWKALENPKRRYFSASMRHLWAWARGETYDPESGIHHVAHAICSLMFILELEEAKEIYKNPFTNS